VHSVGEIGAIFERLNKLERHNRRLRSALVLLVLTVGAVFVDAGAQSVPRTLRAQRFEVVDANGKVLAKLGTLVGGDPRLEFLGPSGNRLEEVGIWNGQPSLELWGPSDYPQPWVVLDMGLSGSTPRLELGDHRTGAVQLGVWSLRNLAPGLPGDLGYTSGPGTHPWETNRRLVGLKIVQSNEAFPLAELGAGSRIPPAFMLFRPNQNRPVLALGSIPLEGGAFGYPFGGWFYPGEGPREVTARTSEHSITAFDQVGRVVARWPVP